MVSVQQKGLLHKWQSRFDLEGRFRSCSYRLCDRAAFNDLGLMLGCSSRLSHADSWFREL